MSIRTFLLSVILSMSVNSSLLADTISMKFTYDKTSRLISTSYNSGQKIEYTYDAASNIKQIKVSNSPYILAPLIMYLLH